jgi:RNA polymerase sigma-70 factor, ECF subfamily
MTESALTPLLLRDISRGDDDAALVAGLRRGDEAAFLELVNRYGPMMLRVAQTYTRSRAVAEEVVQEAWLGVLSGIDRFEERSSLKTWLFRILTNRAKTRGERERRCVPFSSLAGDEEDEGPSVPADRFLGPDHPQWPGHWTAAPRTWSAIPDERLMARETLDLSEGNQRVLLHRARSKVRLALEPCFDGEVAA